MALVLFPLPALDFDPTEVAVSWSVLTDHGHRVVFATPEGQAGRADDIMVTGRGLDPWGSVPLLRNLPLVGLALRANADARQAYVALQGDPAFLHPCRGATPVPRSSMPPPAGWPPGPGDAGLSGERAGR